MGYESKVTLVQLFDDKETDNYASKVMVLDLSKMGYDIGWKELFTASMADQFFYFYADDGNTRIDHKTRDPYDEVYTYAPVKKIYEWVNDPKTIAYYTNSNGYVYERFEMLRVVLNTIMATKCYGADGERAYLVHQGY